MIGLRVVRLLHAMGLEHVQISDVRVLHGRYLALFARLSVFVVQRRLVAGYCVR